MCEPTAKKPHGLHREFFNLLITSPEKLMTLFSLFSLAAAVPAARDSAACDALPP